jgi:hypothetical protein
MRFVTRSSVLLLAVAVLFLFAACSEGDDVLSPNSDMGQVRFVMSSDSDSASRDHDDDDDDDDNGNGNGNGDDTRRLQAANVTFSSMLARNLDGELIDVSIELPVTVDVLGMRGENTLTLPVGFLPPGTYDQIVVVMTTVELITLNGTSIAITPPGGGWTSIVWVCPFAVVEGQETMVRLRFKQRQSFKKLNDVWRFDPAIECDDVSVQPL